jgi:hypothetical protein
MSSRASRIPAIPTGRAGEAHAFFAHNSPHPKGDVQRNVAPLFATNHREKLRAHSQILF